MRKKIEKISAVQIIAFTAVLLIALFVLKGVSAHMAESSARKDGSLERKVLSVSDFNMLSFKESDGIYTTTDNDPQLILEGQQKITSVEFYMESSMSPGEMVVYYKEPGDAEFSAHKRVWLTAADGKQGWYRVEMPFTDVTSLRIDPTMYAGNQLSFGQFILNEDRSLADHLAISHGDVFDFIIYTVFISAILKFLQDFITKNYD